MLITNNDSGNDPFTVSLSGTGNGPPVINSQPKNQTNNLGNERRFQCHGDGLHDLELSVVFRDERTLRPDQQRSQHLPGGLD